MRTRFLMPVLAALLLCGCSASYRPMPDLEDAHEVRAAIASLSPYVDGRPAPPDSEGVEPERGSDRALFNNWLFSFAARNEYKQDPRDWDPVPRTIGEAIDIERAREAKGEAEARVRRLEDERQARADSAAAALAERQRAAEAAAKAASDAAELKAEQERRAAEEAAAIAEDERQVRHAEEVRTHLDPGVVCRMKRQEAASASLRQPGATETGVYQRTWDSFHCPN